MGNSIIAFPGDYCVVDLETTGLNPEYNDIIEIGAVMYSGGRETGRFQTLVRPPIRHDDGLYVDRFIENLTGITNEMLDSAPDPDTALWRFSRFLGDSIILGYNVGFDVRFLKTAYARYLNAELTNDWIDILRMARKLYPEMKHHRLCDMTEKFCITNTDAHRALADCLATEECYSRLYDTAMWEYGTVECFICTFNKKRRR